MLNKQRMGRLAVALALTMTGASGAGAAGAETLVPIRTVAEQIGATLTWDGATATAEMAKGDKALKVRIGSAEAQVGGQVVVLPDAVGMRGNRTYVPFELLQQAFGRDLRWDAEAQRLAVGDLSGFVAQGVENGSRAAYDLRLTMNEAHEFLVTAKLQVENVSQDKWDKVVMYFIPNAFTEAFQDAEGEPAYTGTAGINELLVDGVKAPYTLDYDTLTVPLAEGLRPGEKTEIEVTCRFTLPESGMRFGKEEAYNTYKLAQWYPMLATYRNHRWNKEDYTPRSESYHTAHSDYTLHVDLPAGYSLVSSSEEDLALGTSAGTVTAKNVKELYAQVFKDPEMKMVSKQVDGVDVRFFGRGGDAEALREGVAAAERSLQFFRQNIGPYPHKQLDVMANDVGMEYPGIVTIPSLHEMNADSYKEVIAHEIAHQWFYGVVSSDPYHEGWLDEGMTELATSLYMHRVEGMAEEQAFRAYRFHHDPTERILSNQSLGELGNGIFRSLYAQPASKMWEVFKRNAGVEDPVDTGLEFLRRYYETYSYQQVDTEEFVRFAERYFPGGREGYQTWLKME